MFVSKSDLADGTGKKIKANLGRLNLAAKGTAAPLFTIAAGETHPVRYRATGGARVTRPSRHRFDGGEQFRLSTLVTETDMAKDGIRIAAVFIPATGDLAAQITSMTLPLDVALTAFPKLEEWINLDSMESEREKAEKATAVPVPSVEETRASETWGAW